MIAEILEKVKAYGALHAVPAQTLLLKTGLRRRELHSQIERERVGGAPILSQRDNGGGFFLPSADAEAAHDELRNFVSTTSAQALRMLEVCAVMKRNVTDGGSIRLFPDDMSEELGDILEQERRLSVNAFGKEAADGNDEE